MDAREWIGEFAAAAGVESPDDAEIDRILKLAAVAAHSSERIAAPVACALAASAGLTTDRAIEIAEGIAPVQRD